jgi:integrase
MLMMGADAAWEWTGANAPGFGDPLSLRWRDIDLDAGTVRVRRSAGIVRIAGEGAEMVEDDTKSGKPRVIGIDPGTAWVLRSWKSGRGSLALRLVKPGALVFGDLEDGHRNGEHVWRQFVGDLKRCRTALGADALPAIRLHDLRHTHALARHTSTGILSKLVFEWKVHCDTRPGPGSAVDVDRAAQGLDALGEMQPAVS